MVMCLEQRTECMEHAMPLRSTCYWGLGLDLDLSRGCKLSMLVKLDWAEGMVLGSSEIFSSFS
jgi:hypothetical protein